MGLPLSARTCFFAISLSLSQTTALAQTKIPTKAPTLLEATNIIHGIGHYVGKTLLVRLREDGTVEWETDVDAYKRERHIQKLSLKDMTSVRERLNAIDQNSFKGSMGPFATYTDTFVELRIHWAADKQTKDFIVENPWSCSLPSCSGGAKKAMPKDLRALLCEISSLRSSLAKEPSLISCEPQTETK